MKLAVLIVALCTASSTAITLAAERPKPQLLRSSSVRTRRSSSEAAGLRVGPRHLQVQVPSFFTWSVC